MKTITLKVLVLKEQEEIIENIWFYAKETYFTEFSIVAASAKDKQKYGSHSNLITVEAMTACDDENDVENEFATACAFMNEEQPGAFLVRGFTVKDSSLADKIRFNALLPKKERQRSQITRRR